MMQSRHDRQRRTRPAQFREVEGEVGRKIEGYFATFSGLYELFPGATESIAPTAFDGTLDDDIRALIDHETRLVLGRTKPGTLSLHVDDHGLWGSIDINEADTDAMNLYHRVERGDVDQCSFGFDILDEETTENPDGTIHWTIKSVKLYEVSCVTFPAYEDTSISARKDQYDQIKKRRAQAWAVKMRRRLQHGSIAGKESK